MLNAASLGTGTVELRGEDKEQLELQRMARELQRAPANDAKRAKLRGKGGNSNLAVEIERAPSRGIRV